MKLILNQNKIFPKILFFILIGFVAIQFWVLEANKPNKSEISISYAKLNAQKFTDSILFPEFLINTATGEKVILKNMLTKKIKILILLNTGCYRCIGDLPEWEEFIKNYKKETSLLFLFIAQAPTRKYLNYMIYHHAKVTLPVLYDSLNYVGNENHISEIPTTMLLDKNNKVLLNGSPILHPELKMVYDDTINNLLSVTGEQKSYVGKNL